MKIAPRLKLIGILMLLTVGLPACDRTGSAEATEKKLDQAADAADRKINETSDKVGRKLDEQSAKTGDVIDDAEITTRVKAAIFSAPGLQSLKISVDTVKGVVTLSGSVDSLPSSDRAKTLAGSVAGVKEVRNRLAVKPG
ncbi:MAG: BON domain-containing protein [Parasulfuritortus sp.]|nr:BON domain-containing protein [Parasulfuritortus sp.]